MPGDDPLDIGEADARALKLVLAVQALKDAEQLVLYLGSKPAPLSRINHVSPLPPGARPISIVASARSAGELHRIGYQIDQDHPQQGAIRPDHWQAWISR